MTEHSFLVPIQKWYRLNSVLKIPVANVCRLITPQTHPGQVCALLKFQLCMVCGSNFSSIKVESIMKITANEKSFMPHSCRHAPSPSARIQLSHVTTYASRHYVTTETALRVFHFFTALFSWVTNKNLQHDHCSSICNALMKITGVIETFAICRLYHFHWSWYSL